MDSIHPISTCDREEELSITVKKVVILPLRQTLQDFVTLPNNKTSMKTCWHLPNYSRDDGTTLFTGSPKRGFSAKIDKVDRSGQDVDIYKAEPSFNQCLLITVGCLQPSTSFESILLLFSFPF